MTDQELDAETRAALAGDIDTDDVDDPQVEVLVEDIEVTREAMTGTVEEIGDRLDPRNIVDNAKETVRAATVGKVEDMATTAGTMVGEAGATVREAGSGIVDTITRNPVPAAMVGIGLGWLLMNRQSKPSWERYSGSGDAYGRSNPYASNANRASWQGGSSSSQGGESVIGQAQDKAGQVADQVGRKVSDATDQVSEMASQVPYQVRSTTRELGDQAGRIFEGSPLAVGAIAVAVGTAVGLALPVTETERRVLRQPAQQVLAKAEDAATGALEQVEQKAQDAEQQAVDEDRQARPH